MSKKLDEKILNKIKTGSVKMRPKWIFVLGSVFTGVGVVLATSLGLLAIQLIRFRLNHPGSAGTLKILSVIASMPWYIPVLTTMALVSGYYFLKQFDFSYRKNSSYILALVILGLMFGSYILNKIGVDNYLMKRGYFKRIYNQENLSSPSPKSGRFDGTGRGENKGSGMGRNRLNQTF